MRPLLTFFHRTVVGGMLFLLPLALVLFLVGHLVVILRPAAAEIADLVGGVDVGPVWLTVIVALALVACAFLAGLYATTRSGRSLVDRLETVVLNQVPGYGLIKSAAVDAASSMAAIDQSNRKRAVLIGEGGVWQLGFVTGQVDHTTSAVFIPEAPSAENGTLVFIDNDRIVESGVSMSEAVSCIRRMGVNPPRVHVEDSTSAGPAAAGAGREGGAP